MNFFKTLSRQLIWRIAIVNESYVIYPECRAEAQSEKYFAIKLYVLGGDCRSLITCNFVAYISRNLCIHLEVMISFKFADHWKNGILRIGSGHCRTGRRSRLGISSAMGAKIDTTVRNAKSASRHYDSGSKWSWQIVLYTHINESTYTNGQSTQVIFQFEWCSREKNKKSVIKKILFLFFLCLKKNAQIAL